MSKETYWQQWYRAEVYLWQVELTLMEAGYPWWTIARLRARLGEGEHEAD